MDTLRILMLLSLFLQTILAIFGRRRKCFTGFWLRSVVWLAYLSADLVATLSLGILVRSQTNSANPNMIPVFWAPILLLHLGGPETITAYSLADNELWLRRLVELVIQAGVASYVLFKLWSKDTIIFVAIPIFVSGIIKYGERIWAFRLATLEDFSIRREYISSSSRSAYEVRIVREARLLFKAFQKLSTNFLVFDFDQTKTYELVSKKTAEEAFQLIEIELGFLYDRIYSKVTEISWLRVILHSITCLSSISALVFFSIMTTRKNVYSKKDTMISYLLLVGAVLLDCYSITVLLLSDWAVIWFTSSKLVGDFLYRINCLSPLLSFCREQKRWSRSMGQHNLTSAQSNKPLNELRKQYFAGKWNIHSRVDVDEVLKELIFKQVKDKRSRYDPDTIDFLTLLKLLEERGNNALQRYDCFDKLGWSVTHVEFSQSLLIWHVATLVCYIDDSQNNSFAKERNCVMSSRSLSDYMLYLLVYRPTMLAIKLSGTGYAETTTHLGRLLRRNTLDELHALFLKELLPDPPAMLNKIKLTDAGGMSALLDGCVLAMSLQTLDGCPNEKKWEMISEVWVEMLMYAASHCGWKQHADALARGGELLTHVCLLMSHLGLSKPCRPEVSKQYLADQSKRLDDLSERQWVYEIPLA
ncbi:hypothetical protein POPTR_006G013500v4 [Populus trichocarpa]|uniref:DUF4220 domain-containing protein n=1 Tax=Populus trichocarpa TaxID=3694 RepID=A0A2K1ZV71_POPTR|nr:uncharacterized protein LOC112327965 isoform X2 [Populus trichocarpa]PNT29153.1 hypothetical protein POPTR_006G013500v4 [Populus trichocarpa]|eukprot:XP_024459421.1 uncharacterized protein LOC112327965 [Populus trichocarpa]